MVNSIQMFNDNIVSVEQELDRGITALEKGRLSLALSIFRGLLDSEPDNPAALSLYGFHIFENNPERALSLMHRAVEVDPNHPQWLLNYAKALVKSKRAFEAIKFLTRANHLTGEHPVVLERLVDAHCLTGNLSAAAAFAETLKDKVYSPRAIFKLGHILFQLGRFIEAREFLERELRFADRTDEVCILCIQIEMQLQDYERAAQLFQTVESKVYVHPLLLKAKVNLELATGDISTAKSLLREAPNELVRHPELLSLCLDLGQECYLGVAHATVMDGTHFSQAQRRTVAFSLSRLMDKKNVHDKAWEYCLLANSLYPNAVHYQPSKYADTLRSACTLCNKIESLKGETEFIPVFIIGAPRTGSTLVQNTLCAASEINSVEERGALLPFLLELVSGQTPQNEEIEHYLSRLKNADIAGLQQHLHHTTRYLVDKTPHHVLVVGMLQKIYPDAVFIEVERSARDTAVSILMQDFNEQFEYARKYDDALDYLMWHSHAVDVWRQRGVNILKVRYEEFVARPNMIESIFTHLGVAYNGDYLNKNYRKSHTKNFSAISSRTEIHKRSVGKFMQYKDYI